MQDQTIVRRANAARQSRKLTPEHIREGLIKAGLRESDQWIDGYAFGFKAHPDIAIESYVKNHHNTTPNTFHLSARMYVLAENKGQEKDTE